MSLDQAVESFDVLCEKAPDPGFKARSMSEYQRVKNWVGDRVDLNQARILDFGCGQGIAAASFALRHPGAAVVGFDIEPVSNDVLVKAYQTQLGRDLPPNVSFISAPAGDLPPQKPFNLIYAWSVFEHVQEDLMVDLFKTLKSRLAPGGLLFVQINPLYFSPRGSHLYNYFKSPWHHLILSLDILREGVLSDAPTSKRNREWSQFLQLNRLTASDIVGRASAAGLSLVKEQRFTTDTAPPPRLTRVYDKSALMTTEIVALFE